MRMGFMLFLFGRTKVRCVFLRKPFFQFCLGRGVGRVIGEVLPLKWIGLDVVKFLTPVTVVYVMKTLGAYRMIDSQPVG